MAMALLPTVRLLPLTPCRTIAPTSSPLSVRRPRPRALSIPRVHFCASRTPQTPAAAREAAAFWAGKLAGAVPWKAAFSGVLAVAVSTCRKFAWSLLRHLDLQCFGEHSWVKEVEGHLFRIAVIKNVICGENMPSLLHPYILLFLLPMPSLEIWTGEKYGIGIGEALEIKCRDITADF